MRSIKFSLAFMILSVVGYAQQISDSLQINTYKELASKARTPNLSFEKAKMYSDAYLSKAKNEGEASRIAKGYYLYTKIVESEQDKNIYLDSVLLHSNSIKNTNFLGLVFLEKGSILYNQRNYLDALEYYLKAEKEIKDKNGSLYYSTRFNIGFLQRNIGNYKEAKTVFNECLQQQEDLKHLDDGNRYASILFQLSSIHSEINELEKATAINTKGIQLSLEKGLKDKYYLFVANQGINLNLRKNYNASIDSIEKALPHLPERDRTVSQFYLGKSYHAIGQKEKALPYFQKIDTIFSKTSHLLLQLRETYDFLISDAKQKEDLKLQLYYRVQLSKFDSIHHKTYKSLSKNITENYDIPRLVEVNKKKILELTKEKNNTSKKLTLSIIIGFLISLAAIIGLLYYYRQKKQYQKRYDAIVAKNKENNASIEVVKDLKPKNIIADTIGLDDEAIQIILEQLNIFEKEKHYLTNQISLQETAKIVKTNSKYLSKIINTYKGKTFTNYINDLRVDYLIDRIQNDAMYKKYTIKAIAQEGGFTNSGAFFRAFYKKTGLKPSYFIKKVREEQQN